MTDARLRESERRWQETGAPGDGQRYLKELARCGAASDRLRPVQEQVLRRVVGEAGLDLAGLRTFPEVERQPAWLVDVPGAAAVDAWGALRAHVDETELWPVLLGPPEELELHLENLELAEESRDASLEATLAAARALGEADPCAWARRRRRALIDRWNALGERELAAIYERIDRDGCREPEGPWPEDAPAAAGEEGYTIPLRSDGRRPHPVVVLALLPARRSWEVPALLAFGNWNDCPPPCEHVALFRAWERAHGAEVVGVTHDRVELRVARPPATREAALALARQQYAYCGDIVLQGSQTLQRLAASLLRGRAWSFWWD